MTLQGPGAAQGQEPATALAQAAGQAAWELLADDQSDFYPAGFAARLTPTLRDGVMQGFVWRQGGGVLEGQRLAPATAAAAAKTAATTRNSEGQVMGLVLNQNGQQLRGSKQ